MFKKIKRAIELKVAKFIIKRILKREYLIRAVTILIKRLRNLSDKTEIDNMIAEHLEKELSLPPADHD